MGHSDVCLSHSLNNLYLKPGLVAWTADFYILLSTWIPFLNVPQIPQTQLFLPPPMDLLQLMESSPSEISQAKHQNCFHSILSPLSTTKKKKLKNCCLYFLKKDEYLWVIMWLMWASLVTQLVKNLPTMWETFDPNVWSLGWEDLLEEGMANHSSILAWRIPMARGAWWAAFHRVAKSWTWLRD